MSEWQSVRLGDLGEVNRGRSRHRPRDAAHLYGGPHPFIQTGDVKASNGRVTRHLQTYSAEGLAQSRLWPKDTMVITIAANIAETAILTYPACFPDSIVGFIADPNKADVRFIEYLFRQLRRKIQHENVGTGSVQDNINLQTIARLDLRVPSVDKQRCIARTLGALDDKIDLNRRMNETLEAMARAIFKEWFVDFGPTRAKMEGRAPYLAPEIWKLFPGRLDDKGKPEGWREFIFRDLVTQVTGTISPSLNPEEIFEHYSLPAYDAGQLPSLDVGSSIKSNKTIVPDGVVLLSKLNPEISRVWVPDPRANRKQVASTEFLIYEPRPPLGVGTLDCLLRSRQFKARLEGMVTGTSKSHQRVSPPALLNQIVLSGEINLLCRAEQLIGPLATKQQFNRAESRTLAETRDLLLPKLMSGEIGMKDAEKIAESAL